MKVIDDDDENFPPRNIELTNIFRTAICFCVKKLSRKSFLLNKNNCAFVLSVQYAMDTQVRRGL